MWLLLERSVPTSSGQSRLLSHFWAWSVDIGMDLSGLNGHREIYRPTGIDMMIGPSQLYADAVWAHRKSHNDNGVAIVGARPMPWKIVDSYMEMAHARRDA